MTWDPNKSALENLNSMSGVASYGSGNYQSISGVGSTGYQPLQSPASGIPVIDKSFNTDLSPEQLKALGYGADEFNVETPEMGFMDYGKLGLSAIGTLGNLALGFKGLKLGEKGLAQSIQAFNANYNAQRDLTNAGMYDRNVRRNVEMGQSLDDARSNAQGYVDARGIKALSDKAG